MGRHHDSSYTKLLHSIENMGRGSILFSTDFLDLSSQEARLNLSRLEKDGVIVRIARGIYLYPSVNPFGIEYPTTDELVKAISRRDSSHIIPSGMTAANQLGLSEQVPSSSVYLTDGASRIIRIRGRDIVLKRSVPSNFTYNNKLLPMLVQSLKAIGESNLTQEHINRIRDLIENDADQETLRLEINKTPEWVQRIIRPMLACEK